MDNELDTLVYAITAWCVIMVVHLIITKRELEQSHKIEVACYSAVASFGIYILRGA